MRLDFSLSSNFFKQFFFDELGVGVDVEKFWREGEAEEDESSLVAILLFSSNFVIFLGIIAAAGDSFSVKYLHSHLERSKLYKLLERVGLFAAFKKASRLSACCKSY